MIIVEDNIKTKDLEISFTEPPYTDETVKHEHEHTQEHEHEREQEHEHEH